MKNQNTKQVKLPNGTVYTRNCQGGARTQKGRDRWSEAQIQTLIRLAVTGMRNKEISDKMGRSYSSIVAKRQFLGITKKAVRELTLSNKGVITPESVLGIMIKPEKQPRWSSSESSTLLRLVKSGLTNTEIAKAMGRSVNSVREMRKRSDLPGSREIKSKALHASTKIKESDDIQNFDSTPWRRIMSSFISPK